MRTSFRKVPILSFQGDYLCPLEGTFYNNRFVLKSVFISKNLNRSRLGERVNQNLLVWQNLVRSRGGYV
jgi:hypothetical protein